MARSFWKGQTLLCDINNYTDNIYVSNFKTWLFSTNTPVFSGITIKLHRRSQIITSDILSLNLKFKVYNGYDFFIKELNAEHLSFNLAALVLTRESKVVHKVKLSKEAKRNQQLKLNKKKLSSKTKNNMSKTKKIKNKKK